MMDLRKRLLIIISLVIGVVIVLLLLFFIFNKKNNQPISTGAETTTTPSADVSSGQADGSHTSASTVRTMPVVQLDPNEVYTKQLARIFVERFSSYSNQNDNSHIEDVLSLVTDKMASWLKTQTLEQKTAYQGITTRVIASSVDKIDDTSATILLDTQQIIETDSSQKIIQRSGRVELIKTDNGWKVAGFFWE